MNILLLGLNNFVSTVPGRLAANFYADSVLGYVFIRTMLFTYICMFCSKIIQIFTQVLYNELYLSSCQNIFLFINTLSLKISRTLAGWAGLVSM